MCFVPYRAVETEVSCTADIGGEFRIRVAAPDVDVEGRALVGELIADRKRLVTSAWAAAGLDGMIT